MMGGILRICTHKLPWVDYTMRRYGFGEQTGETEEGGLAQYENGVVEVSEKASKHATQRFTTESPAGAAALVLAEVGGVTLSDHVEPAAVIDTEALRDALESVDGIGEETAADAVEAVTEDL